MREADSGCIGGGCCTRVFAGRFFRFQNRFRKRLMNLSLYILFTSPFFMRTKTEDL